MRLNKYIAHAGFCSRRKADEYIASGNVKINGNTVKDLATKVQEGDKVYINGKLIQNREESKIYIAFHKPTGCVTTLKDEKNRLTVMDLIKDIPERIFPIGRLDYNTSGLLLLTNDGDFANKVAHPKNEIYKTYRAVIAGRLSNTKIFKLEKGVDIGGFVTSKSHVQVIREKGNSSLVEIKIREGKNRQVRKMFAAVGNPVQTLERTAVGNIYLGRLKEGHYRKLTKDEIKYLENV